METEINISQNQNELAWDMARELVGLLNAASRRKKPVSVALSGGSTPKLLFSILGDNFSTLVRWEYVHFFWSDERCVPPDDQESNFGAAKSLLFDKINIPERNIHRIKGEDNPEDEAARYSAEILEILGQMDGLPVFDFVSLGLGEDGHTASIFPANNNLFLSEKICEVTSHPVSGQKRITLTGSVINNAVNILFLVSGSSKAPIVSEIIESPGISVYPAASVEPVHGTLRWFIDIDAASMLSQWA